MSLARELRRVAPPDAAAAEERAWTIVRAAHAERPRTRAPRPRRRLTLALVTAVVVAAAALSPPGLAVLGSLRDALTPGTTAHTRAALSSLPAAGRLLVNAPTGAWIVRADGSKRRLGPYRDATWSPHGLYVAAAHGHDLVAVDPEGNVRWSLTRRGSVSAPSWNAPDGFRIAYFSGRDLHVVRGDGTHDRLLERIAGPARAAWRPAGPQHVLAYRARGGQLFVRDADTGRLLWRTNQLEAPQQLAWSSDGTRLLALGRRRYALFSATGRVLARGRLPFPQLAVAAAFAPRSHSFALVVRRPAAGRSLVLLEPGGRRLFAGAGEISGAAWSPDGRWLLLGWRTADQWLFLRSASVRRLEAVSNIGAAFDPSGPGDFPALAGWCCSY